MTFKDHFSRLAAQYSAFRPSYPSALFDHLASLCRERRLAWDCACGSGQATAALAERFEAVVATDASAQQIASAPAIDRVTFRVAPAESSGLEAGSIDLVTVAQALHWFDLKAFYREVDRVLRAAGVFAVWTYGPVRVEADAAVDELVQEFYSRIVGPYWPPERRLVDDGYRDMPFPYAELDTQVFSMREQWDRSRFLGYLRTWSATARYVEQRGEDPVMLFEQRLQSFWNEGSRVVAWPLAMRIGRKPDTGARAP
jgi:SAM-dependent methyltransferase